MVSSDEEVEAVENAVVKFGNRDAERRPDSDGSIFEESGKVSGRAKRLAWDKHFRRAAAECYEKSEAHTAPYGQIAKRFERASKLLDAQGYSMHVGSLRRYMKSRLSEFKKNKNRFDRTSFLEKDDSDPVIVEEREILARIVHEGGEVVDNRAVPKEDAGRQTEPGRGARDRSWLVPRNTLIHVGRPTSPTTGPTADVPADANAAGNPKPATRKRRNRAPELSESPVEPSTESERKRTELETQNGAMPERRATVADGSEDYCWDEAKERLQLEREKVELAKREAASRLKIEEAKVQIAKEEVTARLRIEESRLRMDDYLRASGQRLEASLQSMQETLLHIADLLSRGNAANK